jgi:hypothetical protein
VNSSPPLFEIKKKEVCMGYEKTIRNAKSAFLLKRGEVVWYDYYDFPNGSRWIVKYKNNFYKIVHDGTGNQFFHSHAPMQISKERAQEILSNYPDAWEEAREYGWWDETLDEYFEKEFGK